MAWSFYDQNGKVLQGVLAVSIDTTELADDAVTSAKIATDAVIADGIAANAVGASELANDAVDTAAIANDAVTADKLADSINTEITANTAKVTNATHTGDVTGATALTIATDAVEGSMVHANVVDDTTLEQSGTQFRIKDNGVTLAKMAGGTDGNLITYDTSGNPAYVATGANDQVLTSNGPDTVPTFQAAAAGGGGAVAREGGNTTESTTTSTSVTDLHSVSSLTIAAATPFIVMSNGRKTAGSGPTAALGLKLNTTVISDASIGGGSFLDMDQSTDEARDGNAWCWFGARVTNYLNPANHLGSAFTSSTGGVRDRNHGAPFQSAPAPNAEITTVVLRGQSTTNVTLGADECHIYSLAVS